MKAQHICFEGMPGSGKTTQAKALVEKLNTFGIEAEYVKSPNGNPFGKAITKILLSKAPSKLAEIYAFWACFCHMVDEVIFPLLSNGVWVVSDKGIGTSYAHALYRNKGVINNNTFKNLVGSMKQGNALYPDATIFLDIPISQGFKRKEDCSDKSRMDICNDENSREACAYGDLSKLLTGWYTIDASLSIDEVADKIWSCVQNIVLPNDGVQ